MADTIRLKDIVKLNTEFRTSVNLYLSLNKPEKVEKYIPTKSSLAVLDSFLNAVVQDSNHAALLIGPYGKGKSHLLLVLLAILSWERTDEHDRIITKLIEQIPNMDDGSSAIREHIQQIWNTKGRFLPVIISHSGGDLRHTFYKALQDALKRESRTDITPASQYSAAIERIAEWKKNFKDTYAQFEKDLKDNGSSVRTFLTRLKTNDADAIDFFKKAYPKYTAGSEFNPLTDEGVLPAYREVAETLKEEGGYEGIYIVFDEFSKFIEGQNSQAAGDNMKLLQDMCELAADSTNAAVYMTLVAHKSIKEYGNYLSKEIINSFTGIEGRLVERFFITSSKNNYELLKQAINKVSDWQDKVPNGKTYFSTETVLKYYRLPVFQTSFERELFEEIVVKGCFPLNPLAAYLLLAVSEKVAQNERTLFTFVAQNEPYSLARYVNEHQAGEAWSVGADLIYDYFVSIFRKDQSNEYVHRQWLNADYALSKCKSEDERKLVKALAVILIVNKGEEVPAKASSLALAVDVADVEQTLLELLECKVLYQRGADETFVFKTRAGIELKKQIKLRRELKGDNVNYGKSIESATGNYFVVPRKYNSNQKMTRFFRHEYMMVEDFLNIQSAEVLLQSDYFADGKVITLYDFGRMDCKAVEEHTRILREERLVVVCPKKKLAIKGQLRDFEIVRELKDNREFTDNNEVYMRELPLLEEDLSEQIEMELQRIYGEGDVEILYFVGESMQIDTKMSVEAVVNICCANVYKKTPIINNEVVNRRVIGTTQTRKTRNIIIEKLLRDEDTSIYRKGSNQEATVYRSLFVQTGLEADSEKPQDKNIVESIALMNEYIDACADQKQTMEAVVERLTEAPYGMRKGVLPVYLAYTLSKRQEDIIAYHEDVEIPMTAETVVAMCDEPGQYSIFVSKEDVEKERYIAALNELFAVDENRNLTENRIKNIIICMQRWYRALPQATKNLADAEHYVSDAQMRDYLLGIKRELQPVEINPYETLFVVLPKLFGTAGDSAATGKMIQKCKEYFDGHFSWLEQQAAEGVRRIFAAKGNELVTTLKEWYGEQGESMKVSLIDGRVSTLMNCIEKLNAYDDESATYKLVKSVSDVYMENWGEGSLEAFLSDLKSIKTEIEVHEKENQDEKNILSFDGRNGPVKRQFAFPSEGDGDVLKNVLEETLEDFEDMSVNDRVGVLLEVIEGLLG